MSLRFNTTRISDTFWGSWFFGQIMQRCCSSALREEVEEVQVANWSVVLERRTAPPLFWFIKQIAANSIKALDGPPDRRLGSINFRPINFTFLYYGLPKKEGKIELESLGDNRKSLWIWTGWSSTPTILSPRCRHKWQIVDEWSRLIGADHTGENPIFLHLKPRFRICEGMMEIGVWRVWWWWWESDGFNAPSLME